MQLYCMFSSCDFTSPYMCKVKSANITLLGIEIKELIGKHESGRSNNDVKAITFSNLTVEYFPRGLCKIFPNLTKVIIHNCGLKSITRRDLEGLEGLEVLYLHRNQLTCLPNDLFTGMLKLKQISLSQNKLESMSSKLLQPILANGLHYVGFEGNTKINTLYHGQFKLEQLMKTIDANCSPPPDDNTCNGNRAGFKELWETRLYSDFIVVAGSKEFKVHRNVLGTQSSVFAAIFDSDMKERNEGKLEIEDFSARAVEEFLQLIYTGDVKDETKAMELFALASKYNVKNIKRDFEAIVLSIIDDNNAIEILNLANLYASEALKEAAFEEVKKMFPEVKLDRKFINKPKEIKELIEAKKSRKTKIEDAKKQYSKKMMQTEDEYAKKKKEAEVEYKEILKMFKENP